MGDRDQISQQLWLTDQRYCVLQVQQNLFGEWELLKAWGGRGSRRGGYRVVPTEDAGQAAALLSTESRRRARRGYWPLKSECGDDEGQGA